MKKIIALLLVLVMLISVFACKRAPETTGDEEIAVAGGGSESAEQSTPEEQKEEVQTPAENSQQTENNIQKQETTETKQEQTNTTEVEKPVEQQVLTLKYPELQELNKQLRKNVYANDDFPTDVYVAEYLPLKLGYVKKIEKPYDRYCYNAMEDFSTKEIITEQMIEAAGEYPYGRYEHFNAGWCELSNVILSQASIYDKKGYENILEYTENFLSDETFVIRGHFEQNYGTAYAYYNVNEKVIDAVNYNVDQFTLHNFVIEKVYTDNCEYEVGDIIEVGIEGTVMQKQDGFYSAASSTGGSSNRYVNFKNASLEERTFVLSVRPKAEEGKYSDIMRLDLIRQNVYEDIPNDGRLESNLSREILAKYN